MALIVKDSYKTEVGDRIRRRRIRLGITQEELGDRIGVSGAHISNWERAQAEIGISYLPPLAKALDVDLLYLVAADSEEAFVDVDLRQVATIHGEIVRELPSEYAREKYVESLLAQAETNRAVLIERPDGGEEHANGAESSNGSEAPFISPTGTD